MLLTVIVGTLSKIQITEPLYLEFVDKTGLSTNMKMEKKEPKGLLLRKDRYQKSNYNQHQIYNYGIYCSNWSTSYALHNPAIVSYEGDTC
jgi:hypothetical protein